MPKENKKKTFFMLLIIISIHDRNIVQDKEIVLLLTRKSHEMLESLLTKYISSKKNCIA